MTEHEWIKHGYMMGVVEPDTIASETFRDMYRQWFAMKSNKVRPDTLDRIECTFRRYLQHDTKFLDYPCAKIDEKYLVDWLTKLILGRGNVTEREFGRLYQILRGVHTYAYDSELIGIKLLDWEKIKRYMPSGDLYRSEYQDTCIPRKDVDTLFRSVLVEDIYPVKRSASMCLILNFYLGLRVGELAALTWNDVDFNRRLIHVNKTEVKYFSRDENLERVGGMAYHVINSTKTLTSTRVLPLCDGAIYILTRLKKWHEQNEYEDTHLAFDGAHSILSRSLDRTMRRLCELNEMPKYNTHKIRKTYASYLHDSGIPIKTISELCGHSEITTTARYYIRNNFDDEKTLRELNGALNEMIDM